ncbi:MAG: circadian clock KaiB family protein [Solirubrobacteraceae bacterium]
MSGSEDEPQRGVVLRLYVAGGSSPSVQARKALERLREHLGGKDWVVEVIDVFESPGLAEADRIIATPVLVRLHPAPWLSVIGDLSDWQAVADVLDLGVVS